MTDDDKYIALMDRYKIERSQDSENAVKYLQAAMKLRDKGNVSQDAIIGAAYL